MNVFHNKISYIYLTEEKKFCFLYNFQQSSPNYTALLDNKNVGYLVTYHTHIQMITLLTCEFKYQYTKRFKPKYLTRISI
jgi:hypothetical protein